LLTLWKVSAWVFEVAVWSAEFENVAVNLLLGVWLKGGAVVLEVSSLETEGGLEGLH